MYFQVSFAFNRTIVELKPIPLIRSFLSRCRLLIEPLWN